MMVKLVSGDCLIAVDVQNDFLPGGALAVAQGERVIPVLNRYIALFLKHRLPIFATRDWHPIAHCSFVNQGGPWPMHCLAENQGSAFAEDLQMPETAEIVSKGVDAESLGYSGFEDTDLAERLSRLNAKRLFVGGLATEYCVLNTVFDALSKGYRVLLLQDAVRAVNPEDGHGAIERMRACGAETISFDDIRA
ncbi:MAG: isochorismatase family protein [Gammaproteobacteria bacterium]